MMLNYIFGVNVESKLTVSSTHRARNIDQNLMITDIYLIDLENKPAFKFEPNNENEIYIGFINSIHNSLPQYYSWQKCVMDEFALESGNNKLLYTIDGGVTDGENSGMEENRTYGNS